MMAKVVDLPEESYVAARHLGKATQYINSIRDTQEDIGLGRAHFPREELNRFGLDSLTCDGASTSTKPRPHIYWYWPYVNTAIGGVLFLVLTLSKIGVF